jgi:hypothetical protein
MPKVPPESELENPEELLVKRSVEKVPVRVP